MPKSTRDGATVVAGDVLAILEEGEVAVAAPATAEKAEKKAAPAPKESKGPVKTSPAVRRLLDDEPRSDRILKALEAGRPEDVFDGRHQL